MAKKDINNNLKGFDWDAAKKWLSAVDKALTKTKAYLEYEKKAKTVDEFFTVLTPEEQYEALKRMSYSMPKHARKYGKGDKISPISTWMETEDDYTIVAHEAYIGMVARRKNRPNMSLGKALYLACWNGCRRQFRQYVKSVSALQKIETTDNGEEIYQVDISSFAAPNSKTPESIIVHQETIAECCLDDRDTAVVSMALDGYTAKEIGDFLGVSRQAVDKRIHNFATRYVDKYHLSGGDRVFSPYYLDKVLPEIRAAYEQIKAARAR